MTRQGKGKRLRDQKGKGKGAEISFFTGLDHTYGTARTHARTHDTKRNDFPVGLTPPTSDIKSKYIFIYSYSTEYDIIYLRVRDQRARHSVAFLK